MKRNILILAILGGGALMTSCKYQRNNTIDQKDLREGDTYVYGVHPDSAAAQTKLTYSSTPELDRRTIAIREKLYGKK